MDAYQKIVSEINCEEAAKRFNDFIDNYLKGTAKDELEHHIENCRHCFDRLEFELMLKSRIASMRKETMPDDDNVKNKIHSILSKLPK